MNAQIKDTPEIKKEKMEEKPTRDDSNVSLNTITISHYILILIMSILSLTLRIF
jgi:hypothetical protein